MVTPDEGHYYGTQAFDLISKGIIKIKVFKEYPFTTTGYADAHRDLTDGKTFGKLVVKVSEE
jgi:NADPH2:quinone reductase